MTAGKFTKNLVVLLVLLLAGLLLTGCPADADVTDPDDEVEEDRYGGVLTVGMQSDVPTFDPILLTGMLHVPNLQLIYDSLIRLDEQYVPQPGLVRDWEYTDDLTLVLYLEENVTFHDGTAFNAEAVEFNIERYNTEESRHDYYQNIADIVILDEYTLELHLTEPDAALLYAMASLCGMMVSPAAVEEYGDEFSSNPVGAGPFELVSWEPLHEVKLEKYEDYWMDGLPYLDQIVIKVMTDASSRAMALDTGDINMATIEATQRARLEENPNIVFSTAGSLEFGEVVLNTSFPYFDNAKVRRALSLAIDREKLISMLLMDYAMPAYQFFPEGHWAYNPELSGEYDPETARQLLEEEGFDEIELDWYTSPHAALIAGSEIIAEDLKAVGINIEVHTLEMVALMDAFRNEKSIPTMFTVHSGTVHPLISFAYLLGPTNNPGEWYNERVFDLVARARATTDMDEQQVYIHEISEILYEEDPGNIIPIWTPVSGLAHRDNVKNVKYDLSMFGTNCMFVWLDE